MMSTSVDTVPESDQAGQSQLAKLDPSTRNDSTSATPVVRRPQVVLILVGLIGSGKSSFAEALQQYHPHFLRCNQDELGDRRAVEAATRRQLQQGGSVCVDRTNIDASQRATWIRIAREFPATLVWVLLFDTPIPVCEARLRTRTIHPTITSFEQGRSVLYRFSSQYEPPHPHEGHDQFLRLALSDQPESPVYTTDAISAILRRLQDAPRIEPGAVGIQWGGRGFPQGRGSGRGSVYRARRGSSYGPYGARGGSRGGHRESEERGGRGGRGYSHDYAGRGRYAYRGYGGASGSSTAEGPNWRRGE